jgi:hypothetical protein
MSSLLVSPLLSLVRPSRRSSADSRDALRTVPGAARPVRVNVYAAQRTGTHAHCNGIAPSGELSPELITDGTLRSRRCAAPWGAPGSEERAWHDTRSLSEVNAPGWLRGAPHFRRPGCHHRQVRHHVAVAEECAKRAHRVGHPPAHFHGLFVRARHLRSTSTCPQTRGVAQDWTGNTALEPAPPPIEEPATAKQDNQKDDDEESGGVHEPGAYHPAAGLTTELS